MLDPETIRFIKKEIQKSMYVILAAKSKADNGITATVSELFPGMDDITDCPVVSPYGFVSSAPDGTFNIVARQGEHLGNRVVIAYKDQKKPKDLNPGEAALYNATTGKDIRIGNSKITLGSKDAAEPLVLGTQVATLLGGMIDQFVALLQDMLPGTLVICTTPGNPSAPSLAFVTNLNTIISQLQSLKSQYISTNSTNILSQETFVERGGS
jgi:hypothetical protein